jgi:hypothetical protein
MSFDMFVQRFRDGDAAPMSSAAFEVLRPYIDRAEAERDFWHLRAPDDGEADIFAAVAAGAMEGLMISRFSAGAVLDLLVEFVCQADAVLLPPGCPALLTAEAQRRHLPDELRPGAVVVRNGGDVEHALRTS